MPPLQIPRRRPPVILRLNRGLGRYPAIRFNLLLDDFDFTFKGGLLDHPDHAGFGVVFGGLDFIRKLGIIGDHAPEGLVIDTCECGSHHPRIAGF